MIIKSDIENYGIVYTPNSLVNNILDLIPIEYFKNPKLKWLDIGAGEGAFSINLYERLFNGLSETIIDKKERNEHIIKNMIYMCEIYKPHINKLYNTFSDNANIFEQCFLTLDETNKYDFIIGNPPYNYNGVLKTPTNNNVKKSDDGKAIYIEFVKKSLKILNYNGYLNLIIPSLWLKPDKAGLYNIFINLKIEKLVCLSTNETNKLFKYQAQTPTTYFLIKNNTDNETNNQYIIPIFDKIERKYINFVLDKKLNNNYSIPTIGINIINKLLNYVNEYGYIKIYKTNTPNKSTKIMDRRADEEYKYKNVKTTIIKYNMPTLIYNYSNIPQQFYNNKKIIMANKMNGFPYFDKSGELGISTRDNYIISENDYTIEELEILQHFLSTKFALFIFSCTNYRMRYLERWAFIFLPNITKIKNFPNIVNQKNKDALINQFFNLSHIESNYIQNNIKDYNYFI